MTEPALHSGDVRIQRRAFGRRMREVGALAWIAGAWLPAPDLVPPLWFMLGTILMLASFATLLAPARRGTWRIGGGKILVTQGESVRVDRTTADLTGAWIEGGGAVLAFSGGDRVMLSGGLLPRKILDDADASPGRLATRFDAPRLARAYGAFLIGLILQIPLAIGIIWVAEAAGVSEERRMSLSFTVAIVTLFLLVRWWLEGTMSVGRDGVLTPYRFRGPYWLPRAEIVGATVKRETVSLELVKGTHVTLPAVGWASARAVADRIEAALGAGPLLFDDTLGNSEAFTALADHRAEFVDRLRAAEALLATNDSAAEERIRVVLRASAGPGIHVLKGMRRGAPARILACRDGLSVQCGEAVAALPYRSVESFESKVGLVLLSVRGRPRRVRLPTAELTKTGQSFLLGALQAVTTGTTPPPHESLARGGRGIADWRAALVTLLQREEGYREVSVTMEDARAALEAPRSTAEQRIGAALGLVAAGSDEDRAHVAAIGARCVEPRLSRAIGAAVRGELDEALVEAAVAGEQLDDAAWAALEREGFTESTSATGDGARRPG